MHTIPVGVKNCKFDATYCTEGLVYTCTMLYDLDIGYLICTSVQKNSKFSDWSMEYNFPTL